MSILVNKNTKVITQGITGKNSSYRLRIPGTSQCGIGQSYQ